MAPYPVPFLLKDPCKHTCDHSRVGRLAGSLLRIHRSLTAAYILGLLSPESRLRWAGYVVIHQVYYCAASCYICFLDGDIQSVESCTWEVPLSDSIAVGAQT
jgi:hypothetical protein